MGLREFYARQMAAYGRYQRFYGPHKGKGDLCPNGSIDELSDFLDDMHAYPSIQYRRDQALVALHRTFDTIRHSPFKVKCAYQRVRYGVSVRDIWSLDYHLACVIAQGMKWIDENDHVDRSEYQEDWNLVKSYMDDLANDRIAIYDRGLEEKEVLEAFARIFGSLWE